MGVRNYVQRIPSEALDLVRARPDALELLRERVSYTISNLSAMVTRGVTGEGFSVETVETLLASPLRKRWSGWSKRAQRLDLDKAGPAIHFLLAGAWDPTITPIATLAPDHVELPWEVTLVSPLLVPNGSLKVIADQVYGLRARLSDEVGLRDARDRLVASAIYPDVWSEPDSGRYLWETVDALWILAFRTARKGDAVAVLTEV